MLQNLTQQMLPSHKVMIVTSLHQLLFLYRPEHQYKQQFTVADAHYAATFRQ